MRDTVATAMSEHKILIVGTGGVGKTALTTQLIEHCFKEEYDPTTDDSYRRQLAIGDEVCIIDMEPGFGGDYPTLRDEYMRKAEGFLCAYHLSPFI